MKRYRCIPLAFALPIMFLIPAIIYAVVGVSAWIDGDIEGVVFTSIMSLLSFAFAVGLMPQSSKSVIIFPDYILCKGWLSQGAFKIYYEQCNIGMAFHNQNGRKLWWIYICDGLYTQYMPRHSGKQINSVRIKPGFIRIMYSDEVYNALLDVLPKKQREALISARKFAGFNKQGKIIL